MFYFRCLLLSALLLTLGCASAHAGMSVSSIPLEGRKYTVLGTAEQTTYWTGFDIGIIGFPLRPPPVDEAYKALLAQKNGDALINLRYSTDRFVLGFISLYRFHLIADVVRLEPESGTKSVPETDKKIRAGRRRP